MDFRDPKIQKIAIAGLAFFIVIYFWYSRVYSSYANQIEERTGEFEMITTNLRNVEMKAKSLDALQEEYTDMLSRYNEIESLLPEVQQIPSFLVQLHTASSLTGTKITKIQPMAVKEESFYNNASFEIEMTGTFHDFGAFVSYVANFPFIANLSKMDIRANSVAIAATPEVENETNEIGKKNATVTVKFLLSTYFVKEGERLQEITI